MSSRLHRNLDIFNSSCYDSIMKNFMNLIRNLSEFGYEIPPSANSRCYAICTIGLHDILTSMRALKRTLHKRGDYRCTKCYSNSPEGKAARSAQAVKLWADPELSKKIVQKSREVARSVEGRKQRSKQSKAAWSNNQYAEFQKHRTSDLFKSEEHRLLVSERNKKDYLADPSRYLEQKVSALKSQSAKNAHKAALANPEYREFHRKLAIERFKNPEYKAKIAAGLEGFSRGGKLSTPEKQVREILDHLNISYVYNKALGPYNFDFWIESGNLYIEVQGEYWHSLPNNERRDRSKYSYLRTADPSAKIIYIWDYDFNSGNAEYKLKASLGIHSQAALDFKLQECVLKPAEVKEAKQFLNSWHYAQFGKAAKFLYGAFLDGNLIGLAKIGPVSRKEIATSLGFSTKECYELDRFCIHPFYHKKNFGSFLIGKATKKFFGEFSEPKALVSFADSTFGHDGTIYKASNWVEVGKTKPDYVYISSDGWVLHKKTLYNQAASAHMTEAAYVEKHGYKKVFGKEKTKFMIKRS